MLHVMLSFKSIHIYTISFARSFYPRKARILLIFGNISISNRWGCGHIQRLKAEKSLTSCKWGTTWRLSPHLWIRQKFKVTLVSTIAHICGKHYQLSNSLPATDHTHQPLAIKLLSVWTGHKARTHTHDFIKTHRANLTHLTCHSIPTILN